eukprot:11551431-Ditylum_brightwellii.AAC.1
MHQQHHQQQCHRQQHNQQQCNQQQLTTIAPRPLAENATQQPETDPIVEELNNNINNKSNHASSKDKVVYERYTVMINYEHGKKLGLSLDFILPGGSKKSGGGGASGGGGGSRNVNAARKRGGGGGDDSDDVGGNGVKQKGGTQGSSHSVHGSNECGKSKTANNETQTASAEEKTNQMSSTTAMMAESPA